MQHIVKILSITPETHDTLCIRVEKPAGFSFVPGHSIMVAINKPGLEAEKRPLTLTSTNDDSFLEFIIKLYEGRPFSESLKEMHTGDAFILSELFGTHRYAGPGLFIAAGVGVVPFLAIFRQLKKENSLIGNTLLYINKTEADIICKEELQQLLGEKVSFILTREHKPQYLHGRVTAEMLKKQFPDVKKLYVCGSYDFMQSVKQMFHNI